MEQRCQGCVIELGLRKYDFGCFAWNPPWGKEENSLWCLTPGQRFQNRFEKMVSSHKLEIWNYGTRERNRGGSIWVPARGQKLG